MNESADPVVSTLTGPLPFLLIVSALATWPIAIGILAAYKRAVRRSMRTRAGVLPAHAAVPPPSRAVAGSSVMAEPRSDDTSSSDAEAAILFADLLASRWHVAGIYATAGLAYALIANIAFYTATDLELLPIAFMMLFVVFAWPTVITVCIVAATTRAAKATIAMAYFAILISLAAVAMPHSPALTWMQVAMGWAMFNLPSSVLFLTFLARPVRAVGPLILTVMFVALAGSNVALEIADSSDLVLGFFIDATMAVGLGAVTSFVALMGLGFVVFAALGWIALRWIRNQYQAKLISDESVALDSMWMLFTVSYFVGLVFEHPAWALAGVVAFAVYKATARAGFSWLRRRGVRAKPPRLLLLRSFSIGKKSERLFDALEKHWRRVGSIQLIAGVDLAARSVEPHEFLDFLSGKLARRFIDGPDTLARRLREIDTKPDRDLRFRVNDFFCYDDTWKTVLSALVRESDAVLMDLRGFSAQNAGCVFEINELAATVPLEKVLFVVDERTDQKLLSKTLGEAQTMSQTMSAGSASELTPRVFALGALRSGELRRLLRALATAVESTGRRVAAVCATALLVFGMPGLGAQSDAQVRAIEQHLTGKRFLVTYREGGAAYGTHFALDVHYCGNGQFILSGQSRRQTVLDNWQVNNWEDSGSWQVVRFQGRTGVRAVSRSGAVDFVPVEILPNGRVWAGDGVSVQPRGVAVCGRR